MFTKKKTLVNHLPYTQIFKDIKKEKGIIYPTDKKVFFSVFLIDELECLEEKIIEHIINNNLNYILVEKISEADVVVMDAIIFNKIEEAYSTGTSKEAVNPSSYKGYDEYKEAKERDIRVIDFCDFNMEIHKNMTLIDEDMFKNIKQMINSNDPETLNVAVSLIVSVNRSDKETVDYLKQLVTIIDENKIKNNLDYRELVLFLSKEYELDETTAV